MEIYVTCPAWIKRRSGLFRNHIENTRLCSILQSSSMLGIILFGGFSSFYSEYVQHLSWQIIFSFCKTTNISLIHKRKSIDIATVMNQNENLEKIQTIIRVVIWQKMRINESKSLESIVIMHYFTSSLFSRFSLQRRGTRSQQRAGNIGKL